MKEFSEIIKITFIPAIIHEGMEIENHRCSVNNRISLTEKPKKSDAGILYEQSLSVVIDLTGNEIMEQLSMCPVIVKLHDDDYEYSWGDDEIPVEMIVIPNINSYKLEFSRQSIHPLSKSKSFK